MGTLLCSCVKVREPIELSLGVVSGVGLDICMLDGTPGAPREMGSFGGFSPHRFEWCIFHTEMYSVCA